MRACSITRQAELPSKVHGIRYPFRSGAFLLTGGAGGELRAWDLRSREMAAHMKGHEARLVGVAVMADDAHVVGLGCVYYGGVVGEGAAARAAGGRYGHGGRWGVGAQGVQGRVCEGGDVG